MPLFAYLCPKCQAKLEKISTSKHEIPLCPECDAPMDRQIAANVRPIFKGTGFYTTDYRNKEVKRG